MEPSRLRSAPSATRHSTGKRVALVVGAGGVKSAAVLGLWRVLEREGLRPHLIVGSGTGSPYAAALSLGASLEEVEALARRLWVGVGRVTRDARPPLGLSLSGLFKSDAFALADDRPLRRTLLPILGKRTFEDARTPLCLVATDLLTGERVVLARGSVFDAVRASLALPLVWRPWRIGERWLCAGSVAAPLPVDVAVEAGADLVLALGFEVAAPRRIRSGPHLAFHLANVHANHLLRATATASSTDAELIPILPGFAPDLDPLDATWLPHVVEQGERAAERLVPYLRRVLRPTD